MPRVRATREIERGRQCERTRVRRRTAGHGTTGLCPCWRLGRADRPSGSPDPCDGKHPAAVFFAAALAGFAVLAGLAILLGLLVTDVLVHTGGIGRADESVVVSIVA